MKKVIGLLTTLALFVLSPSAFGIPINLDSDICFDGTGANGIALTDVSGTSGGATQCYGAITGNDPGPSGDGLLTMGMTFDFISKVDIGDPGGGMTTVGFDIGLSITGDMGLPDASGTWSYNSSLFSAEAFIIVLKAANSPGWAAWLFSGPDAASDTGDWLLAWIANNGPCDPASNPTTTDDNCADISHITIYAKNARVPEPATAALFGLGLIGFGLARRRKIK